MQRVGSANILQGLLPIILILFGVSILTLAFAPGLFGLSNSAGFGPNQISIALGGLAILLSGLLRVLPLEVRKTSEWIFLVLGIIAATFASDLIYIRGLPSFVPKQIMVVSVVLGLIITSTRRPVIFRRKDSITWSELISSNRAELVKVARFMGLTIQLGLLVLVFQQFQLENQAFYNNLVPLVFFGFLIHSLLPKQLRLPFFLLLSMAAIIGVLGFENGIWLVGVGLGLIGITQLRISFRARLLILLIMGSLLAVMRANWLTSPWSNAIWPVLGSIFMFRLIIYMYELKHSKDTGTVFTALSYFFLLPNVVFPLFPVVDYAAFRKTYYNDDAFKIYQTGLKWMVWGFTHLMVYRIVNYYLVLSPENVTNGVELFRYIVSNLLLLLRVTGQFHMVVGILHLFGFNLPRTMNEYFLASSFTDFWRRANIYWKDFMLKVFYYPLYFRLRSLGNTVRLAIATAFVFFVSWFLHAYQWYWLRGSLNLTIPDMSFWGLFGLLVLINAIYESKFGRKRTLTKTSLTPKKLLLITLSTAATFLTLTALWSLWTSTSIPSWISLWSVSVSSVNSFLELASLFFLTFVVFAVVIWIKEQNWSLRILEGRPEFFRSMLGNGALISIFFLIGNPRIYTQLGTKANTILTDLTVARMSQRDSQLLIRGYYEDLIGVDRFNPDLWEIYSKKPTDWPRIQDTAAAQETNDFQILKLNPSTTINFHGQEFSTNSWGMRDQDYQKIPPPDTYRIVLLGPSFVMGSGVANNETFDWQLEQRLNKDKTGGVYSNYEILNFGVAGYSALQELWVYERDSISFKPNAVFFVAHQLEKEIMVRNLADRIIKGVDIPYDFLVEVSKKAGVHSGMLQDEAERLLTPYSDEILSWTYHRVVETSREKGILPVWIFMPTLESPVTQEVTDELTKEAKDAGFVVINIEDIYKGRDIKSLVVAEWDLHPNARGHQLIANKLYQAILDNPVLYDSLGINPK
jgi:hypothetical protein